MLVQMQPSNDGLHLTESREGCRLKAYLDIAGVWTIGYGHTFGVYPGLTITMETAEEYLRQDYATAARFVNEHVQCQLTQHEFDAVCDFVFNVGCERFAGSTMLKDLNSQPPRLKDAANEFDKWVYAGGKKVAGLLDRRQAETQLFDTGLEKGV